MNIIEKAERFAKKAHIGQTRKHSGIPYWHHCEDVYREVIFWGGNEDQGASAWLHDVIEDANVDYYDIATEFNWVVASIVQELTNEYTKENYPDLSRHERKLREHNRISKISRTSKLIKLCDRYCNLKDLKKEVHEFGPNYYYCKESLDLLDKLKGTNYTLQNKIRDFICQK